MDLSDGDDFVPKCSNDVPEDSLHALGKIVDKPEEQAGDGVTTQKQSVEPQETDDVIAKEEGEVQLVERNDKYSPQIGSTKCRCGARVHLGCVLRPRCF